MTMVYTWYVIGGIIHDAIMWLQGRRLTYQALGVPISKDVTWKIIDDDDSD